MGLSPISPQAIPRFNELIAADGFTHLPITHLHALKAAAYGVDHRDPFDRMLAAQSTLESAPLITCDSALDAFAATTVWS